MKYKNCILQTINDILTILFIYGLSSMASGGVVGVVGSYYGLFIMMVLTGVIVSKIVIQVMIKPLSEQEKRIATIIQGILISVLGLILNPIYGVVILCAWLILHFAFKNQSWYDIANGILKYGILVSSIILYLNENVKLVYFLVLFFSTLCLSQKQYLSSQNVHKSFYIPYIKAGTLVGMLYYFIPLIFHRVHEGALYTNRFECGVVMTCLAIYFIIDYIEKRYHMYSYVHVNIASILMALLFYSQSKMVFWIMLLTGLLPNALLYIINAIKSFDDRTNVKIFDICTYVMMTLCMVMLVYLYDGIYVDGSTIAMVIGMKLAQYTLVRG